MTVYEKAVPEDSHEIDGETDEIPFTVTNEDIGGISITTREIPLELIRKRVNLLFIGNAFQTVNKGCTGDFIDSRFRACFIVYVLIFGSTVTSQFNDSF